MDYCHQLLHSTSPELQREAFLSLCDLLTVFAKQLRNSCERMSYHLLLGMFKYTSVCSPFAAADLGALVYSPSKLLQTALSDYVFDAVFCVSEEAPEEHFTDEEVLAHAERLNERRHLLACFLKLVMYSVVEMNMAADVFGEYYRVRVGVVLGWGVF